MLGWYIKDGNTPMILKRFRLQVAINLTGKQAETRQVRLTRRHMRAEMPLLKWGQLSDLPSWKLKTDGSLTRVPIIVEMRQGCKSKFQDTDLDGCVSA